MLVPSPKWLDTGNNAWQLAAATFVGLQSIPGLAVLYGGYVKHKWAINSAFMSIYAFASVLVVWILFDYNMAFGEQWFPFLGKPGLATSASFTTGQAIIPAAAAGMPALTFPMATLIFFQFVFAAITVIILAGSVLGRMNFTACMIFCPVSMTLVWTIMDKMAYGKPSVLGAVNGMIAGLVAITPAAGYVDGLGAIAIGIVAGIIPWLAMNKLQKANFMKKVDDTLSVLSTHGVAGLTGGLLTGIFANPDMLMYFGTDKEAPGVNITGLLYGNANQLLLQAEGAVFIIVYNVIATFIILKVISFVVPLRMDEATLKVGDDAVHGETAYAIGVEGE